VVNTLGSRLTVKVRLITMASRHRSYRTRRNRTSVRRPASTDRL
jgi:hypothetical protein